MAKLLYQGHGSCRITAADGRVIYVDPYAGADTIPLHKLLHPCKDPQKEDGGGYALPVDFILVTHQHSDHNQVQLVTQKPDCRIITNEEALADGKHTRSTSAAGFWWKPQKPAI